MEHLDLEQEEELQADEAESSGIKKLCFTGNLTHSQRQLDWYKKRSYVYWGLFESLYGDLKAADITVGNVEGVFQEDPKVGIKHNKYTLELPDPFCSMLRFAGFDVLSFANNHAYDKGLFGLQRSRQVIMMNRMDYVGMLNRNFLLKDKIQIYAFTTHSNQARPSLISWYLRSQGEGSRYKLFPDHFPVAYIHWGGGTEVIPAGMVKSIAQQLVDIGFKLIVGHGPHRAQRFWSIIDGVPIFYSLGDIMSDNPDGINQGYLLNVEIRDGAIFSMSRQAVSAKVTPEGNTRINKTRREIIL